jgi:uncharacterized cupredoxin-like copper-binding protein
MLFRPALSLLAASVALTGAVACGDDGSTPKAGATSAKPTTPAASELTVGGVDYGYTLSKPSVPAGHTRLTFTNEGKDMHMLAFGELAAGKTLADAQKALASPDDADDKAVFAHYDEDEPNVSNEPDILTAGAETTTWIEFKKPGTYAMVCFFPVAGEKPRPGGPPPFHYERGMLNVLTVTEATTPATTLPAPTAEATMADGKITIPDLSSGKATLKVTNSGTSDHNFFVVGLKDGKTPKDVIAWAAGYFEEGKGTLDTLPGTFNGGIGGVAPGASGILELDLPAGKYAVLCTESTDDDKDHFDQGELVEFTVS